MARRGKTERDLHDLLRKIQQTYTGSPLSHVGQKLLDILVGATADLESGATGRDPLKDAVHYIQVCFESLPQSFGLRFAFDSALIQTLTEDWSRGPVMLSAMIVPRYAKEWGHRSVQIPADRDRFHVVDVVLLPGDDDLRSIDLLDYPWLCHELGHNLHFRDDRFARDFQLRLEERLRSLRTRAIADRGTARKRATEQIDRIERIWTPTPDHNNWPYEIAVDLVALWVCGPAFLATFEHQLRESQPNPHYINQEHPPYDVRVAALIDAARRLDWGDYVSPLERLRRTWSLQARFPDRSNDYLALADQDLITSTVTCGLSACGEFCLPRASPDKLAAVQPLLTDATVCEFGSDLLIAAWLAERQLTDAEYDSWQQRVVRGLSQDVTLESR